MGKSTALSDSVIIVGGGIGGLAAAVACTKVGSAHWQPVACSVIRRTSVQPA